MWGKQDRREVLAKIRFGMVLCGWPDPTYYVKVEALRWRVSGKTFIASVGEQTIDIAGNGRYCVCWSAREATAELCSLLRQWETSNGKEEDVDDKADRRAAPG